MSLVIRTEESTCLAIAVLGLSVKLRSHLFLFLATFFTFRRRRRQLWPSASNCESSPLKYTRERFAERPSRRKDWPWLKKNQKILFSPLMGKIPNSPTHLKRSFCLLGLFKFLQWGRGRRNVDDKKSFCVECRL